MISNNSRRMHVLLVDYDMPSLTYIAKTFEFYSYQVTATQSGRAAVAILSDSAIEIDLVLTDVHIPDLNGFDILSEAVKKGVPTILMSNNEDLMAMARALQNGATFFLLKPLSNYVVKELWQHALRDKMIKQVGKENISRGTVSDNGDSSESSERISRRQRRCENGPRISWKEELHAKFVDVVVKLGNRNCYPKKILEMMNVPGLTRMQVASHLQKCRDGQWDDRDGGKPIIPEYQLSGPARDNGSVGRFGIMPCFAKVPVSTSPSPTETEPKSRLGKAPMFPDTAASSRLYETLSPKESEAGGSSTGNEFYEIMAKLRKTDASPKTPSLMKGPEEPKA